MIKNILFDLGGVLFNIDYAKTVKEFELQTHRTMEFSQENELKVIADYEKGLITTDTFRKNLCISFGLENEMKTSEFDKAWNAMLHDTYDFAVPTLNYIKAAGYRLALLSNINELHYTAIKEETSELFSLFEKVFLSYSIGKRKPDEETFRYVLEQCDWNPQETLYIDDAHRHIDAAKQCGMAVYHWKQGEKTIAESIAIITEIIKSNG